VTELREILRFLTVPAPPHRARGVAELGSPTVAELRLRPPARAWSGYLVFPRCNPPLAASANAGAWKRNPTFSHLFHSSPTKANAGRIGPTPLPRPILSISGRVSGVATLGTKRARPGRVFSIGARRSGSARVNNGETPMSENDRPPTHPAYLSDEAARRINELAFKLARPWGYLLDRNVALASQQETIGLVRYMADACVLTIQSVRQSSEHPTEATYNESIVSRTPGLTGPLRRIAKAASLARRVVLATYRLEGDPPPYFPEPEYDTEAQLAARRELRDAQTELDEALHAIPSLPVASSKLNDETVPIKAMAAAYALNREGKPVSVRAACKRARVDRKNLVDNYPETVALIEALAKPDRALRRGIRDRRTGDVDAWG